MKVHQRNKGHSKFQSRQLLLPKGNKLKTSNAANDLNFHWNFYLTLAQIETVGYFEDDHSV